MILYLLAEPYKSSIVIFQYSHFDNDDNLRTVSPYKNNLFGYHFNESTVEIASEYIKLFNMTIDTNPTKTSFNLMESIVLVF